MAILKSSVKLRPYQQQLVDKFLEKDDNYTIVAPTGVGKTMIALCVAQHFYDNQKGKVLFLAPFQNLVDQHYQKIIEFTVLPESTVFGITGAKYTPQKRAKIWNYGTFFVATPQTVDNDTQNNRLDLSQFSLIIFDEMHLAADKYAYVKIARQCVDLPIRLLGITATLSGKLTKAQSLLTNLNMKGFLSLADDQRTVQQYVFKKSEQIFFIDLDDELQEIDELLEQFLVDLSLYLKRHQVIIEPRILSIKELNKLFESSLARPRIIKMTLAAYYKIKHLRYLIVCENFQAAYLFWLKLRSDNTATNRRLLVNEKLQPVFDFLMKKQQAFDSFSQDIKHLSGRHNLHPKIVQLIVLLNQYTLSEKQVVVFCNNKDSIYAIFNALSKFVEFAGKTQWIHSADNKSERLRNQQVLKSFKNKEFLILLSTSILEAGVHLPGLDTVINYSMPMDERTMEQRKGRVGRVKPGQVIYLIMNSPLETDMFFANACKLQVMKQLGITEARIEKQNWGDKLLALGRQMSLNL